MFYKYSALSKTGVEISGSEEGSYREIKNKLLGRKYQILSMGPDYAKTFKKLVEGKRMSSQTMAMFFDDMKNMLKTGIGINIALSSIEETCEDKVLAGALKIIRTEIQRGLSLTDAFEKSEAFPWMVINMLRVGEKSGGLEHIFGDLSEFYQREAKFKLNLKSAMIYPAVVFCLLITIMFYISLKVIPSLKEFIVVGSGIHPATRAVLFLSSFLQKFWWGGIIFFVLIAIVFSRIKKSKIDKIADLYYRLPVIGPIMKDVIFSTLFLNLSVLQKNGINVIDGLGLIHRSMPYEFISKKFQKCRDYVLSGLSLWQALEKDPFFPPLIYYTIRKGEEMGRLDEYFSNLSRYFSERVARKIDVVLSFVQPVLLGLCAGFLLLVVFSFLVPLYSNLSNIAGGINTN